MKFAIKIKDENPNTETWWEHYDTSGMLYMPHRDTVVNPHRIRSLSGAKKWAAHTIEWFNSTLQPGEYPRTLLEVIICE